MSQWFSVILSSPNSGSETARSSSSSLENWWPQNNLLVQSCPLAIFFTSKLMDRASFSTRNNKGRRRIFNSLNSLFSSNETLKQFEEISLKGLRERFLISLWIFLCSICDMRESGLRLFRELLDHFPVNCW